MAKIKNYIPKTHYSIAMQNLFMKRDFPQFRFSGTSGTGIWQGKLQPTLISPTYDILLKYNVNKAPQTWVTRPKLKENAPHRYKDNSLCLYWYKEWNWSSDQCISRTIVVWVAFWLYFYEIWLDTGEWLAKSAPHIPHQQ